MLLFKVTYRVRAHQMEQFEEIFQREILPLIRERQLAFRGIWRTVVGNAGEYLELWEFDSMRSFEREWKGLLGDTRLQQIFKRTGPMVEGENFSLFEPALDSDGSHPEWV